MENELIEKEQVLEQVCKSLGDYNKEQILEQVRKSLADNNFGDVMVVGGGISGIQASLDLANAGFKVYLVEKGPALGGHMAQLDKTFPTNDCSM